MSKLFWLASYPKSGNTWFRVFLENLIQDKDEPVSVNALEKWGIASCRSRLDNFLGIETSDLTQDEIDELRPRVYEEWAADLKEPVFVKVHDAYSWTAAKEPLIPPAATAGVLYLVRNPLDVSVSYAHHNAEPIEKTIKSMANENYALCSRSSRLTQQVRQKLFTWGGHVSSWLDAPDIRVHLVRYEDMQRNPLETFSTAVAFLGLPHSQAQIEKALRNSSFDVLQGQEKTDGFREKSGKSESFFRNGQIGSWREVLSEAQAEQVVNDHASVMRRLGYLTDAGGPVF